MQVVNDGTILLGEDYKGVRVFCHSASVINDSASGASFEVHQGSESIYVLSNVSKIINEHEKGSFLASWLLVVTWNIINYQGQVSYHYCVLISLYNFTGLYR